MKLRTMTSGLLAVFLVSCASVNTEQFRNTTGKARTLEEIRQTVAANTGSFYLIYQQALERNPGLRGKVVFRIVIQPFGHVSSAEVVSSEINEPELERNLMQQWKRIDFGAKNVDVMIVTYPITFLPD